LKIIKVHILNVKVCPPEPIPPPPKNYANISFGSIP
jgi:hypothetical protein